MNQDRLNSLWLAIEAIEGQASSIPPAARADDLHAALLYRSAILQTMVVSDMSPQQQFFGRDGQATYVRKRETAETNWEPWRQVETMATP